MNRLDWALTCYVSQNHTHTHLCKWNPVVRPVTLPAGSILLAVAGPHCLKLLIWPSTKPSGGVWGLRISLNQFIRPFNHSNLIFEPTAGENRVCRVLSRNANVLTPLRQWHGSLPSLADFKGLQHPRCLGPSGRRTRRPNYRAASEMNSTNRANTSSSWAICSTLQELKLTLYQSFGLISIHSVQLMSRQISISFNWPCPSLFVHLSLSFSSSTGWCQMVFCSRSRRMLTFSFRVRCSDWRAHQESCSDRILLNVVIYFFWSWIWPWKSWGQIKCLASHPDCLILAFGHGSKEATRLKEADATRLVECRDTVGADFLPP